MIVSLIVIAVVCVVQSSKEKGKGSHDFELTRKKSKDDEDGRYRQITEDVREGNKLGQDKDETSE